MFLFMKKFEYRFQYNPAKYNFIVSNMHLCEEKREKEILEMLHNGKTCEQVGAELGYSARTIARRRKDLYYRIKDLMSV